MKLLVQCLAVGGAGFVGAIARFLVAILCNSYFSQFPVGTMVINLSGSFLLGWFATIFVERLAIRDTLALAIATGFVGAYTTFSTWMWESDKLAKDGELTKAVVNLAGS